MALPHMIVILTKRENSLHDTLNACPISSASNYSKEIRENHPMIVKILQSDHGFLKHDSVILADQVFCLTPGRLQQQKVGQISDEAKQEMLTAIYDIFEMD